MAKKSGSADFEFFIDGKPASLLEIAEASGDESTWKSYLERHRGHNTSISADRYLKSRLGEYVATHEVSPAGIQRSTLEKWRKNGEVQAEKLKGRWYYSLQDIIRVIKSADK
jgi:hypothetical protein